MATLSAAMLPRLLIIDDLFGRSPPGRRNVHRENLCAHFQWQDATGDAAAKASGQKVLKPMAQAVFSRGQVPAAPGVGVVVENDLHGALAIVRQGWDGAFAKGEAPWAMVLLDLCFYTGRVTEESNRRASGMPEGCPGDDDPCHYFGLILLGTIHREFPELPIYIFSSKPREEVSLEFSRRGALGFIARDNVRGPELLELALWQHGLLADPQDEIVGSALTVLLALREARRTAQHRENLLIRGERGTGKELFARYVHRVSAFAKGRKEHPFVAVNSAVLTPNLFSSELFGIEPKTATGVDGKIGLIEAADGGDLFLDEIADMPLEVQAAVLRTLQERQITRVGARQARAVDVRFLSATNAGLENGGAGFRLDLLDRLRLGGTLWLPPLRERRTDIPLLSEKFLHEAEARRPGALRREITPEAMERLLAHYWPGNIRELRASVFDAVNRHPDVEHLVPEHLRVGDEGRKRSRAIASRTSAKTPERQDHRVARVDLDTFLETQAGILFDAREAGQWAARLSDIQRAHTWLLARYLEAALEATKRRTPEHPEGLIQIHPAVKLITGDASLTASKAADVIKRILGPLEDEVDGDLIDALAIAVRLRPRSAKTADAAS